jgi:uncharacterized protein with HEPN domain
MLDAAREALDFTRGRTRGDLNTDRMLLLSVVKSLEILGEAASRVSIELQREYAVIPWAQIIAMRNRLIHVYFDINVDLVWDTVAVDLPPLLVELEEIVGTRGGQPGP